MKRELVHWGTFVFLGCAGACSPHRSEVNGTGTPPSVPVQADQCPTQSDDPAGKIFHEEVWDAAPASEHQVMVWLRATSLPAVPACPLDSSPDARCAERDGVLGERQRLNERELACAFESLTQAGRAAELSTLWYEEPHHLSTGEPVPIGLAFGLSLNTAQITRLAQHPFVEEIEPWPGTAEHQGIPAPPEPADCPADTDAAAPKLERIAAIRDQGVQPVVIELADDGFLPPPVSCDDGSSNCSAAVNALWERTVLNTRELTCVERRIDAVAEEDAPAVPFTEATGDPAATPLPPAAELARTIKGFGRALSWDEASLVAQNPFVESVWTSAAVQTEPAMPGCPPDITAPIPSSDCTSATDSGDGKISDAARGTFEAANGPLEVLITVRSNTVICPLPSCSAEPCTGEDAIIDYWTAENLESQRCTRALVTALGGSSDAESFWLVDAFVATLTWAQIQAVALSPDVVSIDPNSGGAAPP